MSYLTSISRTPVTLVILTLDYCARTFGVSPCLATGEPCYNTYPTCKYKTAYLKTTKDYKFTSADAPLPFKTGERPYVKSITYLPCEIKDTLTINSRVTIEFYDEPDSDIGIDPYIHQRSSVQGTFWKKLLARNRNFKNRIVKIYEGFLGLSEAEFQLKFIGFIENIVIQKDSIRIEIKDMLKRLSDIEVPTKVNIKLASNISSTDTTITLTSLEGLDTPSGYIKIDDELIYYANVNTTSNQLLGCVRGYFSTIASDHTAGTKIDNVKYYPPANPFDILLNILQNDAGIASDYIDIDAFSYWKSWPAEDIQFSAIITEPVKLDKLYFEVIELLDCKSWIAEDLKITIRRNIPNEPGRSYYVLTDEQHIIEDSAQVDWNEKSRLTRLSLYWDKFPVAKDDDINSYKRIDIVIDADAESDMEYNEVKEKKIFCRWLRRGYMQDEIIEQYIKNLITRQLFMHRNARHTLTVGLEIKDSDIKTGSYVKVTTDELLQIDGTPLQNANFQVIKRELKNHRIYLQLLKLPDERFAFIAPDNTPDYDNATAKQREYGFITDNNGLINNKSGYYIW